MFSGIQNAASLIIGNPLLGVTLFLAITAGVIFLFSGGEWLKSVLAILRVLFTIFTTPFVFLRDALTIVRNAGEAEQAYAHTRVFTLFRYSRLQYLSIFIGALLLLSSGLMTSALSVYPKYEIDQGKLLEQQRKDMQTQIDEIKKTLGAAASPDYIAKITATRDDALNAYNAKRRDNATFRQNGAYTGPLIDEINNTQSADDVARARADIEPYMASCPGDSSWRGFTMDMCNRFRAFAVELADRRGSELTLQLAYNQAQEAFNNVDFQSRDSAARLETLQANLITVNAMAKDVSLFNGKWLVRGLTAAISTLIATLIAVITFVWIGAILVDILNWIILMMRSLEKTQEAKLMEPAGD